MKVDNQVKQLKLNVTNIHSFLVSKNKEQRKLKSEKRRLTIRKVEKQKLNKEEKTLESPVGKSLDKIKDSVAVAPGMSLLDRLIGFGSLILAGILVNALPGIIKEVQDFINNLVSFVTPIYSGFLLLKAVIEGQPLDDPELSPEKKRMSDQVKKLDKQIEKIKKDFGPLGFIIRPFELLVEAVFKYFRGDKIVLATKTEIDAETGEKKIIEGFKDLETDTFIPRRFTEAEREEYNKARTNASSTPLSSRSSESIADSPDLKTAIRRAESGNDYGATFKAYLDGFSRRNEDITNMSINQVVQYQKDYIAHQRRLGIPEKKRSAAVGAYQMLFPELAASKTGVPLTAKFNKENQDRMADYYLNVAGYQQFINGKITAAQFNDRLAGQFASLKTTSGGGVYDSDGINRAYEDLLDLIKKSKPQPKITPAPNNKGDQARVLNQRDPRGGGGSTTVALQRVNTIQTVPYMMPIPTKSKSFSSPSVAQLSSIWA